MTEKKVIFFNFFNLKKKKKKKIVELKKWLSGTNFPFLIKS